MALNVCHSRQLQGPALLIHRRRIAGYVKTVTSIQKLRECTDSRGFLMGMEVIETLIVVTLTNDRQYFLQGDVKFTKSKYPLGITNQAADIIYMQKKKDMVRMHWQNGVYYRYYTGERLT